MPTWASVASNQTVDGTNLNDAVTNGIFQLQAGQTIPNTLQCVDTTQVETWLSLDPGFLPASGLQLPIKSQFVATSSTGTFQLSPSFGSNFTAYAVTGAPSLTLPTTGTSESASMIGTVAAQTISVTITAPATTIKIDLAVNGSVVNTNSGITTAGTYTLVLSSSVLISSSISIQINT